MARIIDYGIKNGDTSFIVLNGVFILILNIIGFIFATLSHKLAASVSMNMGRDIRDDIFSHIDVDIPGFPVNTYTYVLRCSVVFLICGNEC